ncbi:hypothetical protein GCM10027168_49390 [Streptomyces capparidis]
MRTAGCAPGAATIATPGASWGRVNVPSRCAAARGSSAGVPPRHPRSRGGTRRARPERLSGRALRSGLLLVVVERVLDQGVGVGGGQVGELALLGDGAEDGLLLLHGSLRFTR